MTFSIVARDGTGALGVAVTSSSPTVGSRCMHLRPKVGSVASQNVTDPRYGDLLLAELGKGTEPQKALDDLVARDKTIAHRQIAIVDATGRTASYSGEKTLGTNAVVYGDGAVAAGNLLSSDQVPRRMMEAFESTSGDLEWRLFAALMAGETEGGELDDIHSCGLAVVRDVDWWVTDLRVDWSPKPLDALKELLDIWIPQRDDYVTRGLNPGKAPSYGVAGDE